MPRVKPPITEWQRFLNWFTVGNPEPEQSADDHDVYLMMRDMAWSAWQASHEQHRYLNEFF